MIQSVCRLRFSDPKELNSNGAISETGAGSWAEILVAGSSAYWKGQLCLFPGRGDCGFYSNPTPIPWNQSQFLGTYQPLNEQFLHYSFRRALVTNLSLEKNFTWIYFSPSLNVDRQEGLHSVRVCMLSHNRHQHCILFLQANTD